MHWCNGHQCDHPESDFYVKDGKTGRLDGFCKTIRREQKNARYAADPEWHRAQAAGLASLARADPEWVAAKRVEREAIAAKHRRKVDPTKPRVCVGPCGLLKPPEAYRGNRRRCKACAYIAIKAGQKKADARYAALHPGLRAAIGRRHYWKDVDTTRRLRRAKHAANPERQIAYIRKWRTNSPEAARLLVQRRRARKVGAEGNYTVAEWEALKAQYDNTCLWCRRREPEVKLSPDHIVPLARGGTNWISNIQPLCAMSNGRRSGCQYMKNVKEFDLRPFWPGPLPETVELPDGSLFVLSLSTLH